MLHSFSLKYSHVYFITIFCYSNYLFTSLGACLQPDVHLQWAFIEPKHFKTKEMGNYFFINRTQMKKTRKTQIRSLEKKQSLTIKPTQNTIWSTEQKEGWLDNLLGMRRRLWFPWKMKGLSRWGSNVFTCSSCRD